MTALIKYLESLPGIGNNGPVIIKKYGLKTIADLRKHIHNLPISAQVYIKHTPTREIPRGAITRIKDKLGKKAIIAGSYRRGKRISGDIDIIWLGDRMEDALDILKEKGALTRYIVYSKGNKKMNVIAYLTKPKIKVQIDLYKATKENLSFFLIYLTGNSVFNIYMRKVAASKGLLLNQDGLFKVKRENGKITKRKQLPVKTEREVFKKLGIKYLVPSKRIGWKSL